MQNNNIVHNKNNIDTVDNINQKNYKDLDSFIENDIKSLSLKDNDINNNIFVQNITFSISGENLALTNIIYKEFGINNFSYNCFANSVFQILLHLKYFIEKFSSKIKDFINKKNTISYPTR